MARLGATVAVAAAGSIAATATASSPVNAVLGNINLCLRGLSIGQFQCRGLGVPCHVSLKHINCASDSVFRTDLLAERRCLLADRPVVDGCRDRLLQTRLG